MSGRALAEDRCQVVGRSDLPLPERKELQDSRQYNLDNRMPRFQENRLDFGIHPFSGLRTLVCQSPVGRRKGEAAQIKPDHVLQPQKR